MYSRMGENTNNKNNYNSVSLHIDIENIGSVVSTTHVQHRPPSPDSCIICFDTSGVLVQGSSLIISECACNYLVHEQCLHDWMIKKQGLPACIACNTECFLKSELEAADEEARQIMQQANIEQRNKRICSKIGYVIILFAILWILIIVITENNFI